LRVFLRLHIALTGMDGFWQAIISHGIGAGIGISDTMLGSRYHAMLFQCVMVFFIPKSLICKEKTAIKTRFKIMVFFEVSLGASC